jgi:predicted amidohydrolase YtcJ
VHSAGEGRATIELMEEMAGRGELELRTYVMIGDDSADVAHYLARGPRSALADGRLWVRAIKLYADGALGSRGAALLEPYSDDPSNSGPPRERAGAHPRRRPARARRRLPGEHARHRRPRQPPRARRLRGALRERPTPDHRFRVEHAQILSPDDVPRFAELGVIPSMQGSHQTSDMYWAGTRLGETRLLGAYAWRSLLDAGSIVPNGSDFPVERVDPLLSFRARWRGRTRAGGPPAAGTPSSA